jgi:hypothetical protein
MIPLIIQGGFIPETFVVKKHPSNGHRRSRDHPYQIADDGGDSFA